MGTIVNLSAIFLAVYLIAYFLYLNGIVAINVSAQLFGYNPPGNMFKPCHTSTFVSSSGFIKRVIKLKENREYAFAFDNQISDGDIEVIIRDSSKQVILELGKDAESGIVLADGKDNRYFMTIKYKKASGTYNVSWS